MNRFFFLFFLLLGLQSQAQYYWVFFETETTEELDIISKEYTRITGCDLIGTSKWFNAACVQSDIDPLADYPLVREVKALGKYQVETSSVQGSADTSLGYSKLQLEMLGLDSFHRLGYRGLGVKIGVFDGGFLRVDSFPIFDSMRNENRLLNYYDFVEDNDEVFEDDGHGMWVLSILGGNSPDSLIGAAPKASFVLARTENVHSETHLEEFNWVKAMEWADSLGVDIIHSSLGYSIFDSLQGDYSYTDMDGQSTIITKAAEMAYEKGIFITNSAGNEGDDPWRHITAPCDGKHVLCVGAVDSFEKIAKFSSIGPSSDGRVKPDVVAMGKKTSYHYNSGTILQGNGTSFSGPLMAGFVACLKEKWPRMSNDRIFEAIIRSADRYDSPDTSYGYGLPNILRADSILTRMLSISEEVKDAEGVYFYPNPSNGEVRISSKLEIENIDVYSTSGGLLRRINTFEISNGLFELNELPFGIYQIRWNSAKRVGSKRLIYRP